MKETFWPQTEDSLLSADKTSSGAGLCKILLELLSRRDKLAPLAREFSILDKTLKDYFYGVKDLRLGPYQISGFFCDNQTVSLPKKIQNKYTKTGKVWIVNISKIKK